MVRRQLLPDDTRDAHGRVDAAWGDECWRLNFKDVPEQMLRGRLAEAARNSDGCGMERQELRMRFVPETLLQLPLIRSGDQISEGQREGDSLHRNDPENRMLEPRRDQQGNNEERKEGRPEN